MFIKKLNKMAVAAIVLFLLFAVALGLKFYSDSVQRPEIRKRMEMGFAAAVPIAEALENYKKDNGKYPQDLNELVPQYLGANPQQDQNNLVKFTYHPASEGKIYRLKFTYDVPMSGTDECNFNPEEKKWFCGGKY